ncbi:MAG: hypothetical protein Q6353_019715 [Candidatus Sigynarchaeum springense]
MAWKTPPPPPPDSTDFCTCYQPVSVSGSYCATCGKKLRPGGLPLPPPPGPPATVQTPYPVTMQPVVKPVMVAPVAAQPVTPAMHPLEQRFMANLMGQPVPTQYPVQKPVPQQAIQPAIQPVAPAQQSMPPLALTSPVAARKPVGPPAGITPPSAFPTFTPTVQKSVKTVVRPIPSSTQPAAPGLTLASPIATATPQSQQAYPSPPSGLPSSPPPATVSANQQAAKIDLGFDIGKVDQEISPEQKKALEFEGIMERFKTIITTEQKMLAYDFADKLGVVDFIEDFYEYLSHPDKDGIITYKGDEVKINKTKIMGALMLGDNTMLERAMANFRAWLMKVMK